MHPFLPILSLVFLFMADGAMLFVRFRSDHPEVAPHVSSLYTVILISMLGGAGLAFWLRRYGLLFPGWVAILSLALLGAVTIL